MKQAIGTRHTTFFPTLFLSVLAFGLGFFISYGQERTQVAEIGRLAWAHFLYAAELKDDMAVIDWSKNLEKLESVRAFRVEADSKSVAEGGNQNQLVSGVPEGVSCLFPSDWSFRAVSNPQAGPKRDFVLVYQNPPGPLLWGLFAFFACLVTGLGMGFLPVLFPSKDPPRTPLPVSGTDTLKPSSPSSPAVGETVQPAYFPSEDQAAYLFIDKNFGIRRATPQAAALLRKDPETLVNRHLLDLSPDPGLIFAMEKSMDSKIPMPFPEHPGVSGLLKNDPQGCFLILETASGPARPKKP